MSRRPTWRRLFDGAERVVGTPLERAAQTDEAAGALALLARLSHTEPVDRVRDAVVHAWSLPSHRDVDRLSARVGRIEQLLEELARRIDELVDAAHE